jgi:D-arabinose 1-dehydrogenase-like Zn-dependent alcohol dehydrogenase
LRRRQTHRRRSLVGYAEHITIPARYAVGIPDNITFAEATVIADAAPTNESSSGKVTAPISESIIASTISP